jgi:hypothetical protein
MLRTSEPISRILISFSISTICCSSANANAHGTPSNSALVLITHRVFPLNSNPDLNQLVVVSTLPAMYDRVVGGIISFKAINRSAIVSSSGTLSSSSVEISESARDVRNSYQEQVGEKTNQYRCSSHRHCLRVRLAWSRRTHPRLLLIRPC